MAVSFDKPFLHQLPIKQSSKVTLGLDITWMGDCLGTPFAVGKGTYCRVVLDVDQPNSCRLDQLPFELKGIDSSLTNILDVSLFRLTT